MKQTNFAELSVEQLVKAYVEVGVAQDQAERAGATHRFRPLYQRMEAIEHALRARADDQRHALVMLLDHPNLEVRLNAAKATLAISPHAARKALESIWNSHQHPQAAEAGMTIKAIDDGTFVPT